MRKVLLVVSSRVSAIHHAPLEVCTDPINRHLQYDHRHEFHVKVTVEVDPDKDRQIEFFVLKRDLESVLNGYKDRDLGTMSCEAFANAIYVELSSEHDWGGYGDVLRAVEVFEDGENGAVLLEIK